MRSLVSFTIVTLVVVTLVGCGRVTTPTPIPSPSPSLEAAARLSPEAEATPTEEKTGEASPTPSLTPTETPTLIPIPTFTFTPTPELEGIVNAEPSLNLRSGPSMDEEILETLPTGSKVKVRGRNEAGDWLAVTTEQGDGWVYAEYLDLNAPLDSIPLSTEAPLTPASQPTETSAPATPTLPAVDAEIEAISAGEHGDLLPPWEVGPVTAAGKAEITITNDTPYALTILISQPASTSTSIEACPDCVVYDQIGPESCPEGRPAKTIRLDPATLRVVIRPDTPDFPPFAGEWGLLGDMKYLYCFFLVKGTP